MKFDMKPFDPVMPLEPGATLIEASAGTGKTYSITGLYLRLVAEKGLEVDQILVVTFTEAATAELKERIRRRLREAAQALEAVERGLVTDAGLSDPLFAHLAAQGLPLVAQRLRLAAARMDDAAISTIHGFCQRLLQRHPIETRVEMDAEVLEDEGEWLADALDDAYTAAMQELDPRVVLWLREKGFRSEVWEVVKGLHNHPDATLWPKPDGSASRPDLDAWDKAVERFRQVWEQKGSEAVALVNRAIEDKTLKRQSYSVEKVSRAAREVEKWLESSFLVPATPPDFLKLFRASHLDDKCRRGKSPPRHPLFDEADVLCGVAEGVEKALQAWSIHLAHRLVRDTWQRLSDRKGRARVWSFQDLLVRARDALADPERGEALARGLRAQFRAALIDEFQDTDGVQWEVFRRVFQGPEHFLFLIGDPKQAIYSFRGADIYAYLEARRHAKRHLGLPTNWRSDGRLVQALNTLYARARRPFWDPSIAYLPVGVPDEHREDRFRDPSGTHAPLVIRMVRRADFEVDGTRPIGKEVARSFLPHVVANDVVRLLHSGAEVRDSEGFRPVRPKDLAVLVRKHDEAWAIQAALRARGVPCVLHSEKSVFESLAAQEMGLILWAVLDPDDRTAVRSALTTRFFGLSVPDVAALESCEAKWLSVIEDFRRWEGLWRVQGFSPMFRTMLHERGVLERLLAMEGGERMVTDLLHLSELLEGAVSNRRLGPEALLAWFSRERSSPTLGSDARQIRLESDADAVEVVTMHRAKGLEYGVVFCPSLWDGRLVGTKEGSVRHHGPDGHIRVVARGLAQAAEWEEALAEAEREIFAENLRMAYVAMTRAKYQTFVYWVPSWFGKREVSALGWLLFPHGAIEEQDGTIPCRYKDMDDAGLERELMSLAHQSDGTIGLEPVRWPEDPIRYQAPPEESANDIHAATFERGGFDPTWQWTSFSSLVEGRGGDEPGEDDAARARPSDEGDALLRDFPRGRMAGRCLHAVFERLDFACEDPDPVVREVLAEFGLEVERFCKPVREAVLLALRTPLPSPDSPFRLRDVARPDRMDEVPFLFPVAGGLQALGEHASIEGLARAFERHGGRLGGRFAASLRDLPERRVRGFLSGQMDLVFRVGTRWYLADYKSNDLGPWLSDYAPSSVEDEVVDCRYFLQYHLYAVALYRYARQRQPGFEWDRDFGGVYYLFLRGLDGSGRTGVFHDRPPAALIEALSDVFGGWG